MGMEWARRSREMISEPDILNATERERVDILERKRFSLAQIKRTDFCTRNQWEL